jgi:hypothetical protein
MTLYELTTNYGTYIVHCKPTREQEYRYCRAMMARGYKLSEIMFCHGPIIVHHSPESIVKQSEREVLKNIERNISDNKPNSKQESFFLTKLGAIKNQGVA